MTKTTCPIELALIVSINELREEIRQDESLRGSSSFSDVEERLEDNELMLVELIHELGYEPEDEDED